MYGSTPPPGSCYIRCDSRIQHSQCNVPLIDFFRAWKKKLNSTPSLGQAAALSHILLSWASYLLVLVNDLIVQNDYQTGLFWAMFCFFLCNPVSSLFFQSIFYNLTGTITITSLHLEDVLRSLCYLSAWLINLECHVMSMSKEVADGTMNGITITCWTILLIYKISSDQTLLVTLKKIIYQL